MRLLLREGLLLYVIAVVAMLQLRGVSLAALILFGFPPLFALSMKHSTESSRRTRIAASTFLWLIAAGTVIARFPAIFPNLGTFDKNLPHVQNRALSWYLAIYLVFLFHVFPIVGYLNSRDKVARGEVPTIRPSILAGACAVSILLMCGIPIFLDGFWPVF